MFNFYTPDELKFNMKKLNTKNTLLKIFTQKIETLIPTSFVYKYTRANKFNIDRISTNIINNFFSFIHTPKGKFLTKGYKHNLKLFSKRPELLIAKWIELIFINGQLRILFDLNDIFSNLVYECIKKVNKDKKVTFYEDGISILGEKNDVTSTFVIPNFSSFDSKMMRIENQVKLAGKELEKGLHNQIYFVYPKSSTFKKHIELKLMELPLSENEYRVKLIPYSLSFCLKKFKGNKTCK